MITDVFLDQKRVNVCEHTVLYCFDRVVIAAQCTATFLRSIVLPQI
jgi:hypothetical protein